MFYAWHWKRSFEHHAINQPLKAPSSIKQSYPFDGETFKTKEGHSMHYLDEGEEGGTPVLFLHGNPTWSYFYRNLILRMRTNVRCIAPDHIGCGLSDKPDFPDYGYNLKDHSENIIHLLDHLGIDRVRLVLHDWGGAIGLTAFRNSTDRVEKIVLLNTAAFPSQNVPKRILLCRWPVIGSFLVRGLNGFAGAATWMATQKKLPKEVKNGFLYPYSNWSDRVAVWRFVRDIPFEQNHPSLPLLKETEGSLKNYLDTEVLSCWGMKDFCFNPGFLSEWEEIWPHMKAHRMDEAGHYLLEDSFDDCWSRIEPFLQG